MSRTSVGVAALLVLGACSSAHPARTTPSKRSYPGLGPATSSDSHLITHPEIERARVSGSAYDLIEALRPSWIPYGGETPFPLICVDGGVVGQGNPVEMTLSQIPADNVETIEQIGGTPAISKCGTQYGLIYIKTLQ